MPIIVCVLTENGIEETRKHEELSEIYGNYARSIEYANFNRSKVTWKRKFIFFDIVWNTFR